MNIYKTLGLGLSVLSGVFIANAQTDSRSLDLAFDTRADFEYNDVEGEGTNSGIHGKYLNVILDGSMSSCLTYHWRQRLNKFTDIDNDAFTATDWIYLDYQINEHYTLSAGKQVVLIGGYEYDATPIDVYFASRFWNNIACYQFGISGTYTTNNKKHKFSVQVCNSPYKPLRSSRYAYNFFWSGTMGCYTTLWSFNMIEYERDHYTNFIALGNRLSLDPVDIQFDIMNRATLPQHKYLFSDWSTICKVEVRTTPWMTIMAKGGYDKFRPLPGGVEHLDKPFYGGGFEFFPMHGSRDLRIHTIADVFYDNDGKRNSQINIGLKWRVDLYHRR